MDRARSISSAGSLIKHGCTAEALAKNVHSKFAWNSCSIPYGSSLGHILFESRKLEFADLFSIINKTQTGLLIHSDWLVLKVLIGSTLSRQQTITTLIRLYRCTTSVSLLFAYGIKQVIS